MGNLVGELIEYIEKSYQPTIKEKINKGGSRTIFFRKGGKPLCYIELKEPPRAVIVIGATLEDRVKEADLSDKTKNMFYQAKQYYDGKWMFVELKTKADAEEVKKLLGIKRKPISQK